MDAGSSLLHSLWPSWKNMMSVFPFLRSFTFLYYINNARFKNVKVPIKKFSKKFLYYTKESLLLCTAAGFLNDFYFSSLGFLK